MYSSIIIPLITFILLSVNLTTQVPKKKKNKVILKIYNLRNNTGSVNFGVFKDHESFKDEDAYMNKSFSKANAKEGILKVEIFLPEGTYGIGLLDDENNNGEMDYEFILPKEGFGFSKYYHTGLTKPHFDKFKFDVKDGTIKTIPIKVKYM